MKFLSASFYVPETYCNVVSHLHVSLYFVCVSLFVPFYVWYPCSPFFPSFEMTLTTVFVWSDQSSDQTTVKDIIHKTQAKNIGTSWEGRLWRMIIYVYHLYSIMYWSVGSLRRFMCYVPCVYNLMYWLWIHRDDWRRFVTRHVRDERRTHSHIFY